MIMENLTIKFYTLSHLEIIFLILFALIIFSICSCKFKNYLCWKVFTGFAFTLFGFLAFEITVFNRASGSVSDMVNLTPFHSYYRYFSGQNTEALRSNLMNMILFLPLGLFAAELVLGKWPLWKRALFVVIPCCILSIGIEVLQYSLQCGEAETDDVINNTLGAFFGTLCVPFFSQIFTVLRNKLTSLKTGKRL